MYFMSFYLFIYYKRWTDGNEGSVDECYNGLREGNRGAVDECYNGLREGNRGAVDECYNGLREGNRRTVDEINYQILPDHKTKRFGKISYDKKNRLEDKRIWFFSSLSGPCWFLCFYIDKFKRVRYGRWPPPQWSTFIYFHAVSGVKWPK